MDIFEEIVRLRQEGRNCALATIIASHGSIPSFDCAKMLVRDDGTIVGTIGGGGAEHEVIQAAREVIETEKPTTVQFNLNKRPGIDAGMVCGGSLDIYIEPVVVAPRLFIFGAGHVGLSTYRVAHMSGFEVTIIDERPEFANRERYPEARDIIVGELDAVTAKLALPANAYILIFTPSHQSDMRVLRWAVGTRARYIGMMGSKRKVTGIFHELQKDGIAAGQLERVHAPVGLDIGAQPPEEIAVSVVAELIAARRHSTASLAHLRMEPAQPDARLREVG
jgi:xanthine dehydrogenase accessory factor